MRSKIIVNFKTKILLISLLLILNIIIRYPVLPYEIGTDTFYIHTLSNAITRNGGAIWLGHPLMLFGINEYPLAIPTLISGMSQIFNITPEVIIYIFSLIIGLLGTLAVFMFIKYVSDDFLLAYFTAFFFSITPEFLRLTIWTAATRGAFVAFLPVFMFFLFKFVNEKTKKVYWVILLTMILILLKATHNLFFFLPFIVVSLAIAKIIQKYEIKILVRNEKLNMMVPWFFIVLFIFLIVIFRVGIFSKAAFWGNYQSGLFFKGSENYIIFLNSIIDYVGKMGVLLPTALISIIIIFKKKVSHFEMYLLVLLLLFSPIFTVGLYAPPFLLMIFAFLFSIFVMNIKFKVSWMPDINFLLILMILSQIIFAGFMMNNWGIWSEKNNPYVMSNKNTAEFLAVHSNNGTFTANVRGGAILKYSAYSNTAPQPGSVYDEKNDKNVSYKIIFDPSGLMGNPEDMIKLEIREDGLNQNKTVDSWYQFPELWANGISGGQNMINKYNIRYVLNTNFDFDPYVKTMKFFKELPNEKHKIYDNGIDEIWNIE